MDLGEMARRLRAGTVSSRELVQQSLAEIARLHHLNAFMTVDEEGARRTAGLRDDELRQGMDRGPLHGIPIAHKDLMRTAGMRTTAGSRILADYIPKRDAEVVAKLNEAGAVLLGKTGLHEFAYGITSNNPHYGPIRNPWNPQHIPGGSSGGSAVAVAAGMIPLATGTDTGGSIRVPASFCGIVGLKPTFGRVSCKGVLPLGITQDHVGPMARTVRDAAIAFQAMVGDSSVDVPPARLDLSGIRVGWPQNFFFESVDEEVNASVQAALQKAASMGARVIEVQVPDMEAVRWAAFTSLLSEAAAVLKPYFVSQKENLGEDIQSHVEQGLQIPAVDYLEAQRIRGKARCQFDRIFEQVGCLFTPTTPITAPEIGQECVPINGVKEEVRPAATRFTRGMNALGFPAISIPCGFSSAGLPIGLQIIAGRNQEDQLLRIAAAVEDALAVSGKLPSL